MSGLGKGLIAGIMFALLMPAAVGGILTATASNTEPDEARVRISGGPVGPMQLGTLGRASAVAWISAGHVSAAP